MNVTDEQRLARIEADIAVIKAMLAERCVIRGQRLDALDVRVSVLEDAEQQRKGGKLVLTALMAAAGVAGGLAAKLLPFMGAR